MSSQDLLGCVLTPEGRELILYERAGVYSIRVGGCELMSSRAHGSEEVLARLACDGLPGRRRPRVLIGGLGMGYTLRAALDCLPEDALVDVAEVFPAVVEWNSTVLAHLAGRPLDDRRVTVHTDDVAAVVAHRDELFDAIVLDVDNGPSALTLDANQELYSRAGVEMLRGALGREGCLAVWSAAPDPSFAELLRSAGLTVRVEEVRVHRTGDEIRHTIFVARRQEFSRAS